MPVRELCVGAGVRISEAIGRAAINRTEAAYLLRAATGASHAYLIAHAEEALTETQSVRYFELVRRRRQGEPVAYLVGRREFYGIDIEVDTSVLIPRPETELLVDLALERLPANATARVLDLGTGSGAIAVALATLRPQIDLVAVDCSAAALAVAQRNFRRLLPAQTRVQLLTGDWYQAVPQRRFDLIVSNPPYVAAGDPHLAHGDVRFEPAGALVGGDDGLAALRHIIAGAPRYLAPGGHLLVEHGYDQAAACRQLLQAAGFSALIDAADLAGIPRVAGGQHVGAVS